MKTIVFISGIVLILVVSCGLDLSREETKKEDICGIVEEKVIDQNNHGAPTIYVRSMHGTLKYHVIDWSKKSDFWEYLSTGDSVIKPSGTLIMRIKKSNGEFRDFQYRP